MVPETTYSKEQAYCDEDRMSHFQQSACSTSNQTVCHCSSSYIVLHFCYLLFQPAGPKALVSPSILEKCDLAPVSPCSALTQSAHNGTINECHTLARRQSLANPNR